MDFVNNADTNSSENIENPHGENSNGENPQFWSWTNKNKKIYDVLHGYIEITPLMSRIIDTPEF